MIRYLLLGLAVAALGSCIDMLLSRPSARPPSPRRDGVTLPSGRRLEFTVWPPEAAASLSERAVVLHLHGMVASGDDVHLMMNASTDGSAVEALRHRVALIGLDRPGFGRSDPSGENGRPTLRDLAADAQQLVSALGVERWSCVGFSAGGPIALALGALAPPGLQRVVTVASPWWWEADAPSDAVRPRGADELGLLATWPLFKLLGLVIGPRLLSRFVERPGLAESLGASMARYFEQGAWAAAWESRQVRRGAFFQLSGVELPVDIFQGTADGSVPPEHAYRLNRQLPNSKLHLVPDANHFSVAAVSHEIFAAAIEGM